MEFLNQQIIEIPVIDFGVTTSTTHENQNTAVSVFPNPSSCSFNVVSSSEMKLPEIFNTLGMKIHSEKLLFRYKKINIENRTSGIYLIRINDGKKTFTRKLVVR